MKKHRQVIYVVSSALVLALAASFMAWAAERDPAKSDPANYAGTKACGICHKKDEDGNQLGKWMESAHAKAFQTLGSEESKAIAAKLGIDNPQTSGKCLKCHSTAYHFSETVMTEKIKPEEGVSCESCHGPGKKYMPKSIMEDRVKAIENGLVYPSLQSCTLCHNDKSPTWKPDRYTAADGTKMGFDSDQAAKKIAHPNPKKK